MSFKYIRIADELRTQIVKGTITHKLPTEARIATEYSVSRITVKKAIEILRREEVIYTKQGSGIYVNRLKKNILTSSYQKKNLGFKAEHVGQNFDTVVLGFSIIQCPIRVSSYLNISPKDKVYFIERLRLLAGLPDRVEFTYIPTSIVPNLTSEICQNSIYHYIINELGLQIWKTHDFFFANVPSDEVRDKLQLRDNEPVVNLEQIGYLKNDIKFQYSITIYTNSSFSYKNITYFN